MTKIRIMQVGIGGYGESYLRPMLDDLANDRWELAGVVDPVADRSPLYSEVVEKGIPIYSAIEAFYQNDAADLVIVAAPINYHRFYTVYALEHGSNVLCEKPIAATLDDARAMREAERRSGKFVAIGFQWSFAKAMLAAKRDYLDGLFGKAVLFKTHVLWARNWNYYTRNNWAGKLKDGRGNWVLDSIAHNAAAHYLHSAYFMHGAALDLSARPITLQGELYRANDIENYDTCALRAITDGGCEVLYYATHAIDYQTNPVFEYRYERASLVYNSTDDVPENQLAAVFADGTVKNYGSPNSDTYDKVADCLDAIETGKPVPCGIETALPHLLTINFLSDHVRVCSFPKEAVVTDRELQQNHVPGLADALLECWSKGRLPSEMGCPWAATAPVLDVAGYDDFTGRLL